MEEFITPFEVIYHNLLFIKQLSALSMILPSYLKIL
jgi:hypothetical protein